VSAGELEVPTFGQYWPKAAGGVSRRSNAQSGAVSAKEWGGGRKESEFFAGFVGGTPDARARE